MRAEAVVEAGKNLAAMMDEAGVDAYARECAFVDEDNLQTDFVELPSRIAYWAARYGEAVRNFMEAYADRKAAFGVVICDPLLADELENDLGKKPTAKQVESHALTDRRYRDAVSAEAAAAAERERVRGYLNALNAKRDALVSLGASTRIEMQRDPYIRDPDGED